MKRSGEPNDYQSTSCKTGVVFVVVQLIPSGTTINTDSHPMILNEINARETSRAKSLPGPFRSAYTTVTDWARMAHATVKAVRDWGNDDEIGGDIATIILERGKKCRWFHRPEFCWQQQNGR